MRIPDWYALLVLVGAAYRSTRLVGWDVLTRGLRIRWLTHRAEIDGTVYIGPGSYRPRLDEFIHCPWCLGFWVVAAWWAAWYEWPDATLGVGVVFAASTLVGLLGRID